MLYQILIYVNIIGLAILEIFLGADVSVQQNIVTTMNPGEQQKITVTVNKSEITGFAKLQFDLPEGLTATSNDTKGASFTFKDQKAKFIWMSLPTNETFKISYDLVADAEISGTKVVTGKLSYIENNERVTYTLEPASIDFGSTLADNQEITEPTIEQVATEGEPEVQVAAVPTEEPVEEMMSTSSNGSSQDLAMIGGSAGISMPLQGGVTGTREVSAMSNTEFLVTINIEKGDIRGFGKMQEIIPKGFTALEKNSDDAIFTFQNEVVKFVWLNLPAKNTLTIVYKLSSGSNPEGDYSINGEFSYLLADETQKSSIGNTEFVVGPQPQLAEAVEEPKEVVTEPVVTTPEAVVATEVVKEEPEPVEEVVAEKVEPKSLPPPPTTQPKSVPAPETGINYKVQITAGHNQVGNAYFASLHNYHDMFGIEHHEGWIKYTTGQFNAYKQARDKREGLVNAGHEFPGPFVTAYNDGTRITVQEALMISNQKWFQ